jgi:ketosteroid isomerase-like protein
MKRLQALAAVAAVVIGLAPSAAGAQAVRPGVTFGGKIEPSSSTRGQYQRLIFDLGAIWANCDEALMRKTFAKDVDFSYPTNRVIGIEAATADLAAFCKVATDRSIYFPADAFYIDTKNRRIAAEVQFRVTQNGERQVVNDVWIATIRDGRITVIKEYLDGRVKTLQAQGVLTYGADAPFLTPWPPKADPPPNPEKTPSAP